MTRQSYRAIEVFDITGQGVVAVFDEHIALTGGKPVPVHVTTPDGTSFRAVAYVERLLRRAQPVAETSALLIKAISRHAMPVGSTVTFADAITAPGTMADQA